MKPYYADEAVTLHHGDCLEVLRTLPDASVDAVVTDPPYGLEFMGREWDSFKPGGKRPVIGQADGSPHRRNTGTPSWAASGNPVCRNCGGTKYDRTRPNGCRCAAPDFPNESAAHMRAFQQWCQQWATECLRVLKPGGHLLAFGGTRTVHRLTTGIEDAGFEIRDGIDWLYASGFPKSLNVAKEIDKRRFGSDDAAAFKVALAWAVAGSGKTRQQINAECGFTMRFDISFEKDPVGWGVSLPTPEQYEVICRVLNVEGDASELEALREWPRSRLERMHKVVGHEDRLNAPSGIVSAGRESRRVRREITAPGTEDARRWQGWGTALKPAREPIVVARKPLAGTVAANVLAHGTGALNIDACRTPAGQDYRDKCASVVGLDSNRNGDAYGEWTGTREDSAHPDGRWPTNVAFGHDCHGRCLPGCPVGELGELARFFPVFRYEAKAPAAERPRTADGTAHPTVKPLDLMRWLVRLVTPAGGVVLEPFAGSGTTAEACVLEGFRCIAIEREAAYLPLITARLAKPLQPALDFGAVA